MALSTDNLSSQFCVFCYKTFNPSGTVEKSNDNEQFVKFLSRFVGIDPNKILNQLCDIEKFIKCCTSCRKTVSSFCETYHQLSLLELQLDFKLSKLVGKIEYANRVPTRWLSLIKILETFFQNDKEQQAKCQNLIRSFRNDVVKAGQRRKRQSLPCVTLINCDKVDETSIKDNVLNYSVDEDDISDLEDNDTDYSSESDSTKELLRRYKDVGMDTTKLRQDYPDKICPKCGKKLKSFKDLYVHLEQHKNPSEWEWQCGNCEKKFATEINLISHMKIHTGEKKFVCRFCGYKFRHIKMLKQHLKLDHLEEEGVQEEIRKMNERDFLGDADVRKIASHKYKHKYLMRQIGSTKVLYCQKVRNSHNDYGTRKASENGEKILKMETDVVVPGSKIRSEAQEDINLTSGLESTITGESSGGGYFEDPQIQIKFENSSHLEIGIDSDTNIFSAAESQQQQGYSLPKYRKSKLSNLKRNENDTEESSGSESDDNARKYPLSRRMLPKNPLNSVANPKTLIIKCEVCSREFVSFLKKDFHFKKHHDLSNNEEGGIYSCKKGDCKAYFLTESQLYFHVDKEHRVRQRKLAVNSSVDRVQLQHECPECGKGFKSRFALSIHMEYHKDPSEWKWECEFCGKKSATEYKLKDHVRTHTKEKPFKCRFCEEKFRHDYNLKEHLQRDHADEKEIQAELESKRIRMKDLKVKGRTKKVMKRKRKINKTGKSKVEIGNLKESRAVEIKSEFINDLNEPENIAEEDENNFQEELVENMEDAFVNDNEDENEYQEEQAENMEEVFVNENDDGSGNENGEENRDDTNNETDVSKKICKMLVGDGGIFKTQGKYFGDGTLVEFEDLE